MMWRVLFFIALLSTPLQAAEITFLGRMEQGGLVVGKAPIGAVITFDGRKLPTMGDGRFLLLLQ